MGVYTHWGGAENGGTGGDQGLYRPLPEKICTVHCDPSYNRLVSGRVAEYGTAPIQVMVGAAHPGYPGDKGGSGSSGGGGGTGEL